MSAEEGAGTDEVPTLMMELAQSNPELPQLLSACRMSSSLVPPAHQAGATRFLVALSRKETVAHPASTPVSPELIWHSPRGELGESLKPEMLVLRNECMINGVAALLQLWLPF